MIDDANQPIVEVSTRISKSATADVRSRLRNGRVRPLPDFAAAREKSPEPAIGARIPLTSGTCNRSFAGCVARSAIY